MVDNLRQTVPEGASVKARKVPFGHLNITATDIATPNTLFTVRATAPLVVVNMAIANVSSGTVNVSFHSHLSTAIAALDNAEFINLTLQAGEVIDVSRNIKGYYPEGTLFSVYADVSGGANIHGYGEEIL